MNRDEARLIYGADLNEKAFCPRCGDALPVVSISASNASGWNQVPRFGECEQPKCREPKRLMETRE